jgi:hypothetical protein
MGVWEHRARSVRRCRWLYAACAAAAVSLPACGSVTATGTAASTGSASQVRPAGHGTLCAAAGVVTRLTVSRVNSFPGNHQRFSFPATMAVPDAARATPVARALCALPPEPLDMACPADLGIIYRLDFASAGHNFPPVTIRAGGCEGVSGLGLRMNRWLVRSPAFWGVLGQAMGLPDPGHVTFAGIMPS